MSTFAGGDTQLCIALQHATGSAHGPQKTLVQRVDVQVTGVGFEHRPDNRFRAQARHQREGVLGINQ
ncbi:hypothetical protein D9M71_148630 [compost metagenome]